MRFALATVLIGTSWLLPPVLAHTPEGDVQRLVGSWQCDEDVSEQDLSGQIQHQVTYKADGSFDLNGTTRFRRENWPYDLMHSIQLTGEWAIRDGRLIQTANTIEITNITQPEGMNEADIATLRESIDQEVKIEDLKENFRKPDNSQILAITPTLLATLNNDGTDVFECRREDPAAPQAR